MADAAGRSGKRLTRRGEVDAARRYDGWTFSVTAVLFSGCAVMCGACIVKGSGACGSSGYAAQNFGSVCALCERGCDATEWRVFGESLDCGVDDSSCTGRIGG